MGGMFLRGFGWVALCAVPAVVVQYAKGGSHGWSADTILAAILYAPLAWWVLLGGASVQYVFEATVRDLFGSRQSTMSHPQWYLMLAAAQVAVLAFAVATRLRRRAPWTDPVVLVVGALVLLNAILGADWPWWGT